MFTYRARCIRNNPSKKRTLQHYTKVYAETFIGVSADIQALLRIGISFKVNSLIIQEKIGCILNLFSQSKMVRQSLVRIFLFLLVMVQKCKRSCISCT